MKSLGKRGFCGGLGKYGGLIPGVLLSEGKMVIHTVQGVEKRNLIFLFKLGHEIHKATRYIQILPTKHNY